MTSKVISLFARNNGNYSYNNEFLQIKSVDVFTIVAILLSSLCMAHVQYTVKLPKSSGSPKVAIGKGC